MPLLANLLFNEVPVSPEAAQYDAVIREAFTGLPPGHRANRFGNLGLRRREGSGVVQFVDGSLQAGAQPVEVLIATSPSDLRDQLRELLSREA